MHFLAIIAALVGSVAAAPANLTLTARAEGEHAVHRDVATTYEQEGRPGSCGESHGDSAMIAALGHSWMQHQYKAPHCGRTIKVTNVGGGPDATVEGKGNSVTVRLVDSCDACHNNHIDLSSEAWRLMTNGHVRSKVNVEWRFL